MSELAFGVIVLQMSASMLLFRSGVGGPEQIVSMNSNLPAQNSTF
jgi:hypothetical protein